MGFNRHWIDETNAARSDPAPPGNAERYDRHRRRRVHGHDVRLRPLPRSQVRSDPAERLLSPAGLLRQHRRAMARCCCRAPTLRKKYEQQQAAWDAKTKDIRDEMKRMVAPLREAKSRSSTVTAFRRHEEGISGLRPRSARRSGRWPSRPAADHVSATTGSSSRGIRHAATLEHEEALRRAESATREFDSIKPEPARGQFMIDIGRTAPPTYFSAAAIWDAHGDEVQPGFLSILDPADAEDHAAAGG